MADEEFEEVEEFVDAEIDPDELDVEELDDELDEDFVVLDDELVDLVEVEVEVEEEPERPPVAARAVGAEEEDDEEDLVDPDDVEADLDTILKDRLVAAEDEVEDDDDEVEIDDRGDPVDRIQPKRPGEFVCQSCFLLKPVTQLADKRRRLCRDCV